MSEIQQLSWHHVIESYIANLEEHSKESAYLNELLSTFVSKKLLAEVSGGNEKEVKKFLSQIQKIPVTAKNKDKFMASYQVALERGWINSISDEIEKIKRKSNFYNIWIARSVEIS
ncbi:hypothetical protein, partial [Vibrio sp. V28_P6S34P95]